MNERAIVSHTLFNPLEHPVCICRPAYLERSAWVQHIPLAMLVVELLEPQTLVELGTDRGVSYCTFCQAVSALHLGTRCFAIDTWAGDRHAGFYGDEVFARLRQYHDPLYAHFSTLLRSTFDDALGLFQDQSVDLLHIDGLHTYEAVRHDYETWAPKLSDRGTVLFHDICERSGDFGVWRFWAEVTERYPHFEVAHGHGLGILAVGPGAVEPLSALVWASPHQRVQLESFFGAMGRQWELEQTVDALQARIGEQATALASLQQELADYDRLKDKLVVRALRAMNRHGFLGTARLLGRNLADAVRGRND